MRITTFVVTVALGVAFAVPAAPQPSVTPLPCNVLAKNPEKYVGRRVTFFGSLVGFEMKPVEGKQQTLDAWTCKTKDGIIVENGAFGFVEAEATWTKAAGEANSTKELFRVSGIVKGTNSVNGDTIPFLSKVTLALATEDK